MAQALPKTIQQWRVAKATGFDGLELSEVNMPEVGDSQCLVKIQGASLNVRT
jgi:hypothetical protein